MALHYAKSVDAMTRDEVVSELSEINPVLGRAIEEMGADYDASKITVLEGDTAGKSRQVAEMMAREAVLEARREVLDTNDEAKARNAAIRDALNAPASGARVLPTDAEPKGATAERKSLGELIAGHKSFGKNAEYEVKTLMETAAGWLPESTRSGVVVDYATRPLGSVLDLIPVIPWDQFSYPYMVETTFTNNAAEVLEGGQFGEAVLALTETVENLRKIAVFLPVTDEQLRYVNAARAYIDARLGFMLRQREVLQVLIGNGTAPNISGYLDRGGIQTQAKAADPTFDTFFKAITKVRVTGFAEPDGIVMHPNDWQDIRLTRTADGIYILGNPADGGAERLWGKPVTQETALTEGTGLVGAFAAHSALLRGAGVEIKISDSHSDYFIKGKQAIRATLTEGLAVFREAAFCTATGI